MLRYLYTAILYLTLPLILLRLWWRGRRASAYRRRWSERFGFVTPVDCSGAIWLHAVSVGETRAALPLIRALQDRYPDRPLIVTTITPTGSQQVRDTLGQTVLHCYAPYDLPDAVSRFLHRTRPALAIIMETELWPNLLAGCEQAGIPVLLANARLSPKSARGYRRIRLLTEPMLARLALIAAQSPADGERFGQLGAPAARVEILGNIKYDLDIASDLPEQGRQLRDRLGAADRPVWIAASTHQGEEPQVLDAFDRIRQQSPEALLILVPRHPERFDDVARLCRQAGWAVARRSHHQLCQVETAIYLGDTMGELLLLFAAADVAFVGGSLVPVGGHNVLEPAALGLPVLFGPQMFNFADAAAGLLNADAAVQIVGSEHLAQQVLALSDNRVAAKAMGTRARQVVMNNRGALQRHLQAVERLLSGNSD